MASCPETIVQKFKEWRAEVLKISSVLQIFKNMVTSFKKNKFIIFLFVVVVFFVIQTSMSSLVWYFYSSFPGSVFIKAIPFFDSQCQSFPAHGLISISWCEDFFRVYMLNKTPQLKLLPPLQCRYLILWHVLHKKRSKWSFQPHHNWTAWLMEHFSTRFTHLKADYQGDLWILDSKFLCHSLNPEVLEETSLSTLFLVTYL